MGGGAEKDKSIDENNKALIRVFPIDGLILTKVGWGFLDKELFATSISGQLLRLSLEGSLS